MLVSIQYCIMCGEKFNISTGVAQCNDEMHAQRRKNRDSFCCDCGLRLSPDKKVQNKEY